MTAVLFAVTLLVAGVGGAAHGATLHSSTESAATVTGVNVGPQNVSLQQGSSYTFTAIATGTDNPGQNVNWSVSGENSTGTAISPAGTLTVAPGETATTLTVTATSQDAAVSNSAKVTVIPDRSDGDVNFGVLSDLHTTVDPTTAADARAAAALDFLSAPAQGNQAIINDGDLQGSDTWPEYTEYQNIASHHATIPLYATMGDHEGADYASFTAATGDAPNYVENIDGYTFIMLSAGDGTLNTTTGVPSEPATGAYGYLETWVKQQVAAAEAAAPDKPVFVFRFNPMPNTTFQSYAVPHSEATGLESTFTGDPHIVLFTAEDHSPNNDPLSIWQDGGYTAVNVPATVSAELQSGEHSGTSTPFAQLMSQGLEVSATGSGGVDIKTRDFLSGQYVQDWSFNVNQPLPYTMANRLPEAVAPVFPSTAAATLTKLNNTSVDITSPQATEPANKAQDGVYDYQYTITNDDTGKVEQQYHDWNPYWVTPLPSTVTEDVTGLTPSTKYTVQICGTDYYQIVGTQCLSTAFTTAQYDATPHQLIDYALPFNGSLANDGLSPNPQMLLVSGSQMLGKQNYKPGNGGGQALQLDPLDVAQIDSNPSVDYGQSFTVAFWMNVEADRSGHAYILSNRNVDNGGNTGYDFYTQPGSDGQLYLHLQFHPTKGTLQDLTLAQVTNSSWTTGQALNSAGAPISGATQYTATTPDWMHVAATFDYATNTITAYIDGNQVAQATDDLSLGIGGITGQGLIASTLLGSSAWNYTEEYGGTNGVDKNNDIIFLADDFVLASTVYTPAQVAAEMNNFTDRPATHTVTYNAEGGTPTPASQTVFEGVGVTEPAPPTKAGYTFDGWFTAPTVGTEWNFTQGVSAGVTADTTLYAQYTAHTTTTVTTSGSPSQAGHQVTYTATVSPAPDGGTVSFTDNGTSIAGCSAAPVSGATATCTTAPATAGANNITAAYSGTSGFSSSTSSDITQVVTKAPCSSLAGCNLSALDLSGAQLTGANLTGANLNKANLSGADLAGANLSGVNLNGANLTGANLTNANLTGANLRGATVSTSTNLNKVTWSGTTCPDSTDSDNDGGTCTADLMASAQ